MPILDAIHEISGVSDTVVSIGTGTVWRGGVKMNNLDMMHEYASNMQYAIDGIIENEFKSVKPNREMIEFLTAQSMAFDQMDSFCEWMELKENAPETGISHGAMKK